MDRLERMSRAEGMSLNAMAIRVDNAALMATLPDTGIASEDIVADVDAGRRWSP